MLDRAYAPAIVKAVEGQRRRITGIASTPTPDRRGDILEPLGATFANPVPLLYQHDTERPVGLATLTATADGIQFEAEFPEIPQPGHTRDRVTDVLHLIGAGLIRAVSVGFRPLTDGVKSLKGGGLHFLKTEICELSLVTIPMNVEATIRTIKSYDTTPGVSGTTPRVKPMAKQTISEHIQALENKRAALAARMTDLMETTAETGATLEAEAATEHDGLTVQVKSIDADLCRWREHEKLQITQATPVSTTAKQLIISPNGSPYASVSVKPNTLPGTGFIRYCQALAVAKGSAMQAVEYAKRWEDSTPEVGLVLKAAVAAGTTTDATWAGPLAPIKPLTDEFIAFLRPATILGKIPGFLKVPFNVSVAAQTGGGTYQWVGQGAPKPVGKLAFATVTLGVTKCAGIIVITEELARTSSPDAEQVIRRDMIAGIAQFLDTEFIDPTKAAVAGVSPGSVTNGVTPITTAGTSPANARTDIQALANAMTVANISTNGAVLVMSETNALALTNALNPLGQSLFPGMGGEGGTIMGYKAVTSQVAGTTVAMIKPDQILYADDGGVTIDVSREASLQMDSAPMAVPDATVVLTSLWQMNYVGLRAERFINWKKARTGVVQYTVATYAA